MHSHCSSVCTRQCLFVKFVWAYGCIFAANSSICSFLLPFANSSLRFSFSVVHVHGLKVFIIDHIQFHACGYPNEILQRVSLYINICIYFSLYPFIKIFCIIVLAHVIYFFQWAPFQGPTTTGTYIDTTKSVWGTLIRHYFLHFFSMHFGNEKIQSSEQNTQYWKLSDIVTLSNTEGST